MQAPRFAIYYADGTVIEGGGEDDELVPVLMPKSWLEAPSDGVVCITQEDYLTGRHTHAMADFYYLLPVSSHGQGTIGNAMSIGPYLRQTGFVKFGGWTHTKNYDEIRARAARDNRVHKTTARLEPRTDEATDN